MRLYKLKTLEETKAGFTDLCIVETADMSVGFSNKQITLRTLEDGDLVQGALIDLNQGALVTGPTGAPTGQVKVGSVAITPTCAVKTAKYAVTDNTVVGATTATGAATAVLDLQAGGGDSAAATAGEIWVWLKLNRNQDRASQA